MVALRYVDNLEFKPADFPLKALNVDLNVEVDVPRIPAAARSRLLADALRRLIEEVESGRASPQRSAGRRQADGTRKTPFGDLHPKSRTSLVKFLSALHELSAQGGAATLGDVGAAAGLSGPVLAKVVNPKTDLGKQASPLIKVEKKGRAKHVALTAKGRKVAKGLSAPL